MTEPDPDDTSTKVLRRTVIKIAGAGGAVAATGGQAAADGTFGGVVQQEDGEDDAERDTEAVIVFPDQTVSGGSVTIESATLPEGGFVSLQDPSRAGRNWREQHEQDFFDLTVLGSTEYLEPGTHEDLELELSEPLEVSRPYQVWVHPDTNDNEEFDYAETAAEEDFGYFFLATNPVIDDAFVTLQEDGEDGEVAQTFELIGNVGGWQGVSPDTIEGVQNPNLSMPRSGNRYRVVWENGDGESHNFVIRDGDGNTVVETEYLSEEGATTSVEFEATDNMVQYICVPHASTMRGEVIVGEGQEVTATTTADGNQTTTSPGTETTPGTTTTPETTTTPGTTTTGEKDGLPGFGVISTLTGIGAGAAALLRWKRGGDDEE